MALTQVENISFNQCQRYVLFVLGGGISDFRERKGIEIWKRYRNKIEYIVITGSNSNRYLPNRIEYFFRKGIKKIRLVKTQNTLEEFRFIKSKFIKKGYCAIIISDILHLNRLNFLEKVYNIENKVFLISSDWIVNSWKYPWFILYFFGRESAAYIYYYCKFKFRNKAKRCWILQR